MEPNGHPDNDVTDEAVESLRRFGDATNEGRAAREWLSCSRPRELRELCDTIAGAYQSVENRNPARSVLGKVEVDRLQTGDPFAAYWPDQSLVARELMFRANHLYRSLGILTQEAGLSLVSSLPVVGRTLMEVVAHVDWILTPVLQSDSAESRRLTSGRVALLKLHGVADKLREANDFNIVTKQPLERALATPRVIP